MKTNFELLMSIKWYFEIKNLSLKKILEFKTPLSVEQQNELRLYYSQYFTSLLSATELLSDKNENLNFQAFKTKLEQQFIFDSFTDDKHAYSYLRELRNSIIHRGLDITSSSHFENDFPLIISPIVTNQNGGKTYNPFGFYLLDVIKKYESCIPDIIFDYFQELNILKIEETQEQLCQKSLIELNNVSDLIMPDRVKNEANKSIQNIDYISMQKQLIEICLNVIKTDLLGCQFKK